VSTGVNGPTTLSQPPTSPANPARCHSCNRELAAHELDGLCAPCLWSQVLGDLGPKENVTPRTAAGLLRLPGHELLEEISRGGMGIVYRARQFEPTRLVALKMLLPQQSGSAEMRERFQLEIRAGASLDHAAILPVYQVGEHDGLPFYSMKLATGGTLAERKAEYLGNHREVAQLIATLADALHFAHERGVLHRDIKPGNVLFDDAGRAYISDFGLAKFTQGLGDTTSALTRSISLLGTPQYMAPEIASAGPKAATIAADVYSLGCILYELLTSRPPFEAESVTLLLKRITDENPTPPSIAANESKDCNLQSSPLPRDLEIICLKALAKEPARRYVSAQDFATDLRHWLNGEAIEARETTSLERLWLWSKRHRAIAALLAMVFILTFSLLAGLTIATVRVSESRSAALQTVESLESQKANDLFAAGSTAEAIALLARRVRANPENWADSARLMSALQNRTWAGPQRQPVKTENMSGLASDHKRTVLTQEPDGNVLAFCLGTNLAVYEVLSRSNYLTTMLPFASDNFSVDPRAGLVLVRKNKLVRIFNYRTGQWSENPLRISDRFAYPPVVIDPRGKTAFVVAPDSAGELVNLATGERQPLVPSPSEKLELNYPVGNFFPNSLRLALSDCDQTVHIVDLEQPTPGELSFVAATRVMAMEISPDERVLMTQGSDQKQFWDLQTGQELPANVVVGATLSPARFHGGTSRLYLGANSLGLVSFEPLTGEVSKLPARGALLGGQCWPDRLTELVAVQFERFVGVYNGESLRPLCQPLPVGQANACPVPFAGDAPVTLDRDGFLTLWRIGSNRLGSITLHHDAAVQAASFSPDGTRVVTASHDGTARIWDVRTGQSIGEPMVHRDKVWSACFSPDGHRVATISWDTTARIWNAQTGEPLSRSLEAKAFLFHARFSPDGSALLTCGVDGTVRIYDAATGERQRELTEPDAVYWASFSPDGKYIVTRPRNANPKLWDAHTAKLVKELVEPWAHGGSATVVTRGDFSRDGTWLALGSADRMATLWQLPEGELQAVLNHVAVVRTATFSPDAKTLLTTSDDLTAQLWDVRTGKVRGSPLVARRRPDAPPNTGNSMRAAAIHMDGLRAVTGGSDAAARLWDVRNGNPIAEPAEFDGSVMSAEFSPDGRRLLVACFDGNAHILQLPPKVDRAPEWLAPLAEALVGQRFDAQGAVTPVPTSELWDLCEQLRHLPADDLVAQWAQDCLGF